MCSCRGGTRQQHNPQNCAAAGVRWLNNNNNQKWFLILKTWCGDFYCFGGSAALQLHIQGVSCLLVSLAYIMGTIHVEPKAVLLNLQY